MSNIFSRLINLGGLITGKLPIVNGGTNATTKAGAFDSLSPMTTAGDVIYGGTSGTGTRLAPGTGTQVLHGGTTPTWAAVTLSSDTTGILPLANGGTNANLTASAGAIPYSSGSALALNTPGTGSDWVLSGGTGAPTCSSTTTTAKTFSAAVKVSDGTVGTPSVGFTSDDDGTGTGIYRVTTNSLGFTSNGVAVGSQAGGNWVFGATNAQTRIANPGRASVIGSPINQSLPLTASGGANPTAVFNTTAGNMSSTGGGGVFVVTENNAGKSALIFVNFNASVTIIAQTTATFFVVGAPTLTQIGISVANANAAITFTGGTTTVTTALYVTGFMNAVE